MPEVSLSSENAESFQNSRARREEKKWLISSLQLRQRSPETMFPRCALKSSHFFSSQCDSWSNYTLPVFDILI